MIARWKRGRERGRVWDGAGTGTRLETRGRTQDGSTGGNESSSGDRNGSRNENEIGKGGEAKKREKLHKGETSVERQKRWQERVRSVATDPDKLESSKEAEREAQGTQGLSKNCTQVDRVCPLCRA